MHAVVHSVTINGRSAAAAELDQIVPQVSSMPGFAAGYWVARSADTGIAMVMFKSEEAAQGFADFLKGAPDAAGVTLDRDHIDVGQVLAHA
jgi:hypothetical protein